MKAKKVVAAFWKTMQTNNFYAASEYLSEDYECHWPQSSEIIRGRKNFAEINTKYPSNGPWTFFINNIVSEGDQVVSDVSGADGKVKVRAITFSIVKNGLIAKQIEFWPDNYEAPEWRRQWIVLAD